MAEKIMANTYAKNDNGTIRVCQLDETGTALIELNILENIIKRINYHEFKPGREYGCELPVEKYFNVICIKK